ncbi:putative F420-0 ABC transporter substrate-binding protein [Salinibacterium sp. SYSU T00001]|uniref:putative F420-0 ABC transporter substrate-binding protein n=1 Tax=Homoserinimonas sedimenticola TaxID=2986805 RepID=UPI0022358F91|nr:putative F420-0 ABC transporter substrate-binding protein [Salinibacterium sedimenticola]MCW4385555.1 putative F420-0 ABC transporter substrate-binding protein [Salinibacterium sedimenticola]
MPHSRHISVPLAAASVIALALTGCTSQPVESDETDATAPATSEYPLTIDNCGTEITIDGAPQRIVTIKSSTAELLLALGLEERLVGVAALDGPLPDETEVDIVSDSVPGQEAVLALEPDFVFAGWESNFSAEGAGERERLEEFGVETYVAPAACKRDGYMPDPLTFEFVFDSIAEAGVIFDAREAADELLTEQRAALESVEPVDDAPSALWYSSGRATPYVGAGIGSPQMIMDAAGLDNIFADIDDSWSSVSWETVVAANPEVIVLVDSDWNTAESKIAVLEENPATAALDAVREGRYVVLPFAATEAGVRNVEAVTSAVEQLRELGW